MGYMKAVSTGGPGYRIYLGQEGRQLIILLGGGAKKQQQRDISVAKELWKEYKQRQKKSEHDTDAKF